MPVPTPGFTAAWASQIFNAQPNPAHYALAELERVGRIHSTLTQNIDILHQKAGSRSVIELHGSLQTLTCTQCYHQVQAAPYMDSFVENGEIPRCPKCDQTLKPDVILFGEQLPQTAWFQAQRTARQCDLMLVAGSSLEVLPVAGLPIQALDHGAHLIVINNTTTYVNVRADIVITENVATIIPEIMKRVIHG
jgi:NAD-dependent deacetylase